MRQAFLFQLGVDGLLGFFEFRVRLIRLHKYLIIQIKIPYLINIHQQTTLPSPLLQTQNSLSGTNALNFHRSYPQASPKAPATRNCTRLNFLQAEFKVMLGLIFNRLRDRLRRDRNVAASLRTSFWFAELACSVVMQGLGFMMKWRCIVSRSLKDMCQDYANNYKADRYMQLLQPIAMEIPDHITKRLDSLPFSRWHIGMIAAIGTIWIFDGYEVSLVSLFSKYILEEHSQTQYRSLANMYQIGCIIGSFLFGLLTYFYGRRAVFLVTLGVYGIGVGLCLAGDVFVLFMVGRLLTGISVGGEFTAIFTAVDQFLPPSVRGRADIIIDGSWHLGGCLASIINLSIGDTEKWRYLFAVGLVGLLGLAFIRRSIPESPRWLIMKGRHAQAQDIVSGIQNSVLNHNFFFNPTKPTSTIRSKSRTDRQFHSLNKQSIQPSEPKSDEHTPQPQQLELQQNQQMLHSDQSNIWSQIKLIVKEYKLRFAISCLLIYVQAFFFNSVYYQYPILLKDSFNMSQREISGYMLGLSVCSFVSTLIIGPFFDLVGRRKMLLITYATTGILLPFSNLLTETPIPLQLLTCLIFIFGSPASSAANLIASEIFPTSTRPIVLSFIFVVGMFGGMCGVWVNNYYVSGGLMVVGGLVGGLGVPDGENRSLEEIVRMNKGQRQGEV